MDSVTIDKPQLFNTDTRDLSLTWIDRSAVLKVPVNPDQYYAYQLQECIAILKQQAKSSPAQFNSKNLIELLNEFRKACEIINRGDDDSEVLGSANVAQDRHTGAKASHGDIESISMDS